MNYSELQDFADRKKITLQSIAEGIGMSRVGMKTSFENQTLPIKKVKVVCDILGITPNQFFGIEEKMQHKQVQNGGVGNTQNMDVASAAMLQEQLRIKDEQLKAKDEQISKLMDLLAK